MIVFLFGPSGSGKTVLGESLSSRLSFDFLEADDFHPQEDIEKMKRGEPLTDDDCSIEEIVHGLEKIVADP